jgi:hypothetical protein
VSALGSRPTRWRLAGLGLGAAGALAAAAAVLAQSAGTYDLSFAAVTGGGGGSSAGQYALTGVLGQAAAEPLIGPNYRLQGGLLGAGESKFKAVAPMVARDN